jgi:hypothetical protein
MLERDLEAAPHQPGVEGVVAVLDQHCTSREAKECPAHVPELGCADQHRAIDLVAPARIWVDGSAAVDQRVEERERAVEPEPLGPDLENEEGRIAGRLDVQGHELGVIQLRLRPELGRVDRDLRPRHRLDGAARLEQDRLLRHLASASALLANAISSAVTARSSRAAPAYTAAPTTIGIRIRSPSRLLSGSRTAPMTTPASIGRQLI